MLLCGYITLYVFCGGWGGVMMFSHYLYGVFDEILNLVDSDYTVYVVETDQA